MSKLTALLVASTLALGTTATVFAAENMPAHAETATSEASSMHHKGAEKAGRFSNLNLTDQQRQQIKELMKESYQPQNTSAKDERKELHRVIAAENFDEVKAKAYIDTISKAQSERMLARARTENKIYNLLTPEQKKQYSENSQHHEGKMMEHGMMEHRKKAG